MRTLSSFNHSGPDEVPIAILLRQTALKASVGIDPIERRPSSGRHPGWAIPHGTRPPYAIALIQGWAKRSVPTNLICIGNGGHGASAPLPTRKLRGYVANVNSLND